MLRDFCNKDIMHDKVWKMNIIKNKSIWLSFIVHPCVPSIDHFFFRIAPSFERCSSALHRQSIQLVRAHHLIRFLAFPLIRHCAPTTALPPPTPRRAFSLDHRRRHDRHASVRCGAMRCCGSRSALMAAAWTKRLGGRCLAHSVRHRRSAPGSRPSLLPRCCRHLPPLCVCPLSPSVSSTVTAADSGSDVLLMMRAISETIGELIKWAQSPAAARGAEVDVRRIKNACAARVGANRSPKLVDILAALPDEWRKKLAPLLTAKPIRSASGISVVAVMCKPHRCPHIAMTGNICVYCIADDHEILTNRGFRGLAGQCTKLRATGPQSVFVRAVCSLFFAVLFFFRGRNLVEFEAEAERAPDSVEEPLLVAAYDHDEKQLVFQEYKLVVRDKEPRQQTLISFEDDNEAQRWGPNSDIVAAAALADPESGPAAAAASARVSLLVTPDHRMFVQAGRISTCETGEESAAWDGDQVSQGPGQPMKWVERDYRKVLASELLSSDAELATRMLGYASEGPAKSQFVEVQLRNARHIKEVPFHGRTWCVSVPTGKIVVRRAFKHDGKVVKASLPIIMGNCPGGPDSDFEYSTQAYTGYGQQPRQRRRRGRRAKARPVARPGSEQKAAGHARVLNC